MPSSPLDKQIAYATRAIRRANDKGHETAGLEARLKKLMVKKNLNKAERRF